MHWQFLSGPEFYRSCSQRWLFKISPNSFPEMFKIFPRNLITNSPKSFPQISPNSVPEFFVASSEQELVQNCAGPNSFFAVYCQGILLHFTPNLKNERSRCRSSTCVSFKFGGTNSGNWLENFGAAIRAGDKFRGSNSGNWA